MMIGVFGSFFVFVFGIVIAADPHSPECINVLMWKGPGAILSSLKENGIFLKSENKYVTYNLNDSKWLVTEDEAKSQKMHYSSHPNAFSIATSKGQDQVENGTVFIMNFVITAESGFHFYDRHQDQKSVLILTCHIGVSESDLYWPITVTANYQWAQLDSPKTVAKTFPAHAVHSHPLSDKKQDHLYGFVGLTTFRGRLHYAYIVDQSLWLSIYDSASSRVVRITRPGRHTKILVSEESQYFSWFKIQIQDTNSNHSYGMNLLDWTLNKKQLASVFHVNVIQPVIYRCTFVDETALLMQDQLHFCPDHDYEILVTNLH